MKAPLTYNQDGNAIEYRMNGILLARCLVTDGHPQEHMIEVVSRIRVFRLDIPVGSIDNYRAARAIWEARISEEQANQATTQKECSTCGKPSDGWPDSTANKDGELCQMCWEAECSRSWWQMMGARV